MLPQPREFVPHLILLPNVLQRVNLDAVLCLSVEFVPVPKYVEHQAGGYQPRRQLQRVAEGRQDPESNLLADALLLCVVVIGIFVGGKSSGRRHSRLIIFTIIVI